MYKKIARFYDAIHAELTDDIPFILELAEDVGSPILELGCGTGRVLKPLALNGFEVVGVDESAEMIERMNPHPPTPVSRAKDIASGREGDKTPKHLSYLINFEGDAFKKDNLAGDRRSPLPEGEGANRRFVGVRVYQQNILHLDLPRKDFALAIFSHNTAHHFNETELATVFGRVREHLRDGGWLLIDLFNPLLLEIAEDADGFAVDRTFPDPETGRPVVQQSRWINDVEAQIFRVEWQYQLTGGAVIEAQTDYHYIAVEVLQGILQANGFEEMMLFGGYESEPYTEDSYRLIIVAR